MNEENIIETYAYEDGSVVRVSDAAYRDKTPDQLRAAWEAARASANEYLKSHDDAETPYDAYGPADNGKK